MENKILEIFIPGPAGRLEAKYYKSKKSTAGLDLSKKKVYVSSGEKVGEDVKISSKPRNIIEFIKNGKKSKDRK